MWPFNLNLSWSTHLNRCFFFFYSDLPQYFVSNMAKVSNKHQQKWLLLGPYKLVRPSPPAAWSRVVFEQLSYLLFDRIAYILSLTPYSLQPLVYWYVNTRGSKWHWFYRAIPATELSVGSQSLMIFSWECMYINHDIQILVSGLVSTWSIKI